MILLELASKIARPLGALSCPYQANALI